ncbi:VirK/YbjX family protein [Vibrio splendidus]|uniref:VirK/YbjX family protein n=1 Tax=Vibrio splendidus TaxID=29497 RepID=UPI0024687FA8|nr:VirK/YbjX family protein [Vibrio splendidus]MDH6026745.1 VirK/YbjX family protein [Vibrio splendidus]
MTDHQMTMNKSIVHQSKTIYSEQFAENFHPIWIYRIKFIARALFYRKAFNYLANNIEESVLEMLCTRSHRFLEKPFRPYIIKNNPAIDRSELVIEHYKTASELISPTLMKQIYTDSKGLTLMTFEINEILYTVKLVYEERYQKEGDMSLVLHSQEDGNFYTISFILGNENGIRCIKIGGLQGPRSNETSNEKIKNLTRKLYGQRPKSLMVSLLSILAQIWGIETILAVKTHSHTFAAKRYKNGRIKTDYDALWIELGGTEYDRNFYSLNVNAPRRDIEGMSRSKRSMYRRRYEWLDNTKTTFEEALKYSYDE